jgi:hypothetical protein
MHHCQFHIDSISEQQVVVSPLESVRRVEMQNSDSIPTLGGGSNSYNSYDDRSVGQQSDIVGKEISNGLSYEYYVAIFFLFYGSCWYILKLHTDDSDEQDL